MAAPSEHSHYPLMPISESESSLDSSPEPSRSSTPNWTPILSALGIIQVHRFVPQAGPPGAQVSILITLVRKPAGHGKIVIRVRFGDNPVPTAIAPVPNQIQVPANMSQLELIVIAPPMRGRVEESLTVDVLRGDNTEAVIDCVQFGFFVYLSLPETTVFFGKRARQDPEEEDRTAPAHRHPAVVSLEELRTLSLTSDTSPITPLSTGPLHRQQVTLPTFRQAWAPIHAQESLTFHARFVLEGDLGLLCHYWDQDEWQRRRRLVQFWRRQEGINVHVAFAPMPIVGWDPNLLIISCIYREKTDDCYFTFSDLINLLEGLLCRQFNAYDRKRLQMAIEHLTIISCSNDLEEFLDLIKSYNNPQASDAQIRLYPWGSLKESLDCAMHDFSQMRPWTSGSQPTRLGMRSRPLAIEPELTSGTSYIASRDTLRSPTNEMITTLSSSATETKSKSSGSATRVNTTSVSNSMDVEDLYSQSPASHNTVMPLPNEQVRLRKSATRGTAHKHIGAISKRGRAAF